MGISPKEYARMTYYDFNLKAKGFRANRDFYENIARNQAFITFLGYANPKKTKSMTVEKFWKMDSDKKVKGKEEGVPLHKNPERLKDLINQANGKTGNRDSSKK